jgi:beta-glucanase (GH16 family)
VLASPGTGIVSCAILQSSDLDEIDWEWLGGTDNAVQTDYFGKGNTTKADREVDATVDNAQITSHNYTVRWTQQTTTWLIDGEVVRTLEYADAVGGSNYPQTPMNIRVGIWAGGDSGNDEGTIDWAGGETDYSDGPFTMVLEKIEVVNYNPGKSYVYGNMSGEWESIEIQGGNDGEDGDTTAESTQIGTAVTGSEQTSTATGMWWTASASAIIAQAKSSGAAMEGGSWWNVLELVAVSLFVGL